MGVGLTHCSYLDCSVTLPLILIVVHCNRPFPSSLVHVPLFQSESKLETINFWKWFWFAWKWNCMQNSFSCERFCTYMSTCFETAAQENSEMACFSPIVARVSFLVWKFSFSVLIKQSLHSLMFHPLSLIVLPSYFLCTSPFSRDPLCFIGLRRSWNRNVWPCLFLLFGKDCWLQWNPAITNPAIAKTPL